MTFLIVLMPLLLFALLSLMPFLITPEVNEGLVERK